MKSLCFKSNDVVLASILKTPLYKVPQPLDVRYNPPLTPYAHQEDTPQRVSCLLSAPTGPVCGGWRGGWSISCRRPRSSPPAQILSSSARLSRVLLCNITEKSCHLKSHVVVVMSTVVAFVASIFLNLFFLASILIQKTSEMAQVKKRWI